MNSLDKLQQEIAELEGQRGLLVAEANAKINLINVAIQAKQQLLAFMQAKAEREAQPGGGQHGD